MSSDKWAAPSEVRAMAREPLASMRASVEEMIASLRAEHAATMTPEQLAECEENVRREAEAAFNEYRVAIERLIRSHVAAAN